MKVHVHSAESITSERRERLERLVRLGFTRFATEVRQIAVSVGDQNGPRGGLDQRCVVRVELRGLAEIVIEETHESVEQALGIAVARASRSVSRALERRRRHREYVHRRFVQTNQREDSEESDALRR